MGKKLFLRTCNADGSSHNGFVWPTTVGAEVICPDWDPKPECGNGLHGLLDGGQDSGLLDWNSDALWMAVEAEDSDCVDLGGKWKFSRCVVMAVGTRKVATDYLVSRGCMGVHGSTLTGGDGSTLTGGYGSTLTFSWWDSEASRKRLVVAYVGESGILPNVAYRLNDQHAPEVAK